MPKTMYKKIWDAHLVRESRDDTSIIYVDLHLVHEVTSPQAFEGLRLTKHQMRCPKKTFATMDHNIPTRSRDMSDATETSRIQIEALENNCKEFGITL